MSRSIAEQAADAVAAGGGQHALARHIQALGGNITQPHLSAICRGRRADPETLRWISKAVKHVTGQVFKFEIDGDTDIGASRAKAPSEKR